LAAGENQTTQEEAAVADEIDPLSVPWVAALQHRPRPNEVPAAQMPAPAGAFVPRQGAAADLPAEQATAIDPSAPSPNPLDHKAEPSYYNLSMLKAPLWKWEIASYFFLGGLSAGAFILARMAERFGGDEYADLTRIGTYIAGATILPAPGLLIHDLGDPKRFHHMLRVWKPTSPMNLGTWALTAYSGVAATSVLREYLSRGDVSPKDRGLLNNLAGSTLLAVQDAAGVPLALMIAGYTGVLLNSTANPLWCKNPWLGPLFSASAIATGAAAINLVLGLTGTSPDAPSRRALSKIDSMAHLAEAVTLTGFIKHAGERAKPLTQGSMRHVHLATIAGLVTSEFVKHLPVSRKTKKWTSLLSSAAGLAGGFALRWAMVHGGLEAGKDPRLARLNSQSASKGASTKPVRLSEADKRIRR
jgi:formate-dependent nitrite reductase membrane component NrfD